MSNTSDLDIEQLKLYNGTGLQFIPLHKWNRTSEYKGKKREDGKRPLHNDWTTKPYDNAEVLKKSQNVGIRLTAKQLVVDVDPRNMPKGRDTFKELCDAVGLDPSAFPTVNTGSGGYHVYMTKPANGPVVDTVEGYDGVEFKTKGRQVVAAGSRHPNGKIYEWDFLCPDIQDGMPPAPERLLALIRRPAYKHQGTIGGGEHSQQEIATMLEALNPEDYREHSKWLTFMMACHHASRGDARSEFIDWSTRDPEYSEDAWLIGRRWDSLHRSKGNAVTYRSLYKELRDAGKEEVIPKISAVEDFDDDMLKDFELPTDDPEDGEGENIPEHEQKGPMARLSEKFTVVVDGGKVRIMYKQYDPSENRTKWVSLAKHDFELLLINRKIERLKIVDPYDRTKDKVEIVPVSKAWLEMGTRKTAQGVVFDPEREHPQFLNLWTGWGVQPARGSWSYLEELIHEVLCDGKEELTTYLKNWMAFMVQKPWEPPEVAICFRGDKGVGKSTLGNALVSLAGRHGMQVVSPRLLTGNFNAHLQDIVMLFADEAIPPTDRNAQNVLKSMITERTMTIEKKGVDVTTGLNRLHVMMASNHDWFVSAGLTDGERRYFVTEVNRKRQEDKKFFGALHKQLYKNGGLSAMLHDLQLRDLDGWQPRGDVPQSKALVEQKLRNMEPLAQWWFNILDSGVLPFETVKDDSNWKEEWVRVWLSDIKDNYNDFCKQIGLKPGSMNKSIDRYFFSELKKLCSVLDKDLKDRPPEDRYDLSVVGDGRARSAAIPSLKECRKLFSSAVNGEIDWNS